MHLGKTAVARHKALPFAYLLHVCIDRDCLRTVQRKQSDTISDFSADPFKLHKLLSHQLMGLTPKSEQPLYPIFSDELDRIDYVASTVPKPEFLKLLLSYSPHLLEGGEGERGGAWDRSAIGLAELVDQRGDPLYVVVLGADETERALPRVLSQTSYSRIQQASLCKQACLPPLLIECSHIFLQIQVLPQQGLQLLGRRLRSELNGCGTFSAKEDEMPLQDPLEMVGFRVKAPVEALAVEESVREVELRFLYLKCFPLHNQARGFCYSSMPISRNSKTRRSTEVSQVSDMRRQEAQMKEHDSPMKRQMNPRAPYMAR